MQKNKTVITATKQQYQKEVLVQDVVNNGRVRSTKAKLIRYTAGVHNYTAKLRQQKIYSQNLLPYETPSETLIQNF